MIKARYAASLLLSVILTPISFSSSAQVVDVSDCRAIEDRLQRFDCYESLEAADTASRQEEALRQSPPREPDVSVNAVVQPQVSELPVPETTPQAGQAVGTFGTRSETASVRVIEGTDGKTELTDTIASLDQRRQNLWVITLASGQRWGQMISKPYPMRAGDEVRIYPTRWGSAYRLSAPRLSGYIQVERMD